MTDEEMDLAAKEGRPIEWNGSCQSAPEGLLSVVAACEQRGVHVARAEMRPWAISVLTNWMGGPWLETNIMKTQGYELVLRTRQLWREGNKLWLWTPWGHVELVSNPHHVAGVCTCWNADGLLVAKLRFPFGYE